MEKLIIEGKKISITNPDIMIWEEAGINKIDYIQYLLNVAPFLLEHAKNRLLMIWIYPHGIDGKRIEKRSLPSSAPDWVSNSYYKEKQRILLNDKATLVWAANYGALEFHVPFDTYQKPNYPLEMVFDLDPPDDEHFDLVLEIALKLKDVLGSLGLTSVPRTSGSTGMQIFIPIASEYPFEETRKINKFIAEYLVEKMPSALTLERAVEKRENKVYFDYLQLWKGRTMPAVYSSRGKPQATVATPVTWEEVQVGFHPTDFSIVNISERIREKGDLFSMITTKKTPQNLDEILLFIKKH
ncbi:non-homologous end-joining DNA ligase [Bacillus sp. CECT 9360]|uniref:non-homologous end-joining DNA ligase n=1 Tax=Bacillus sp. CECT 9360 TaxID=2845821 RepID=UPI001E4869E6|nr:non-homologous end-joining DNA ligase [Bacillus sp. CECT 9360]CAH0344109.1 Bifunctional non-homologous end joining protein LigD [Bacillus sp. CECT 9360]